MPKEKDKGGRPLKFKSVEELQKACNDYFDSCTEKYKFKVEAGKEKVKYKSKKGTYTRKKYKMVTKTRITRPFTITGLSLALDTSRQTLINYEKRDKFFDTIKRSKLLCENYAEEYLYQGKNTTGAIFNLKNNYNWVEESTLGLKGGISLTELFDGSKK